jgi:Glycosyl transferase family 2
MAMSAKVTVGIATYNRAASLRETVESVLAQRFGDFRVIISDNASEDNTAEVIASFADPRIEYVRSEQNVGMTGNFNRLIELADTEFLMLLPDDDVLYPDYLGRVIEALGRYPTAGFAHTAFDEIDAQSNVHKRCVRLIDTSQPVVVESGDEFLTRSMTKIPVIFSTATYRTRAIVAVGGIRADEEPFADMPMWMRIAVNSDVVFLAEPLAGFRVHDGSVTKSLVAVDGEQLATDAQLAVYTQHFFERRVGFLDQAELSAERALRYRSLATLRYLSDRGGQGVPWMTTTSGLIRLVRLRPRILLHPTAWRLIAAQFGGRQARSASHGFTSWRAHRRPPSTSDSSTGASPSGETPAEKPHRS